MGFLFDRFYEKYHHDIYNFVFYMVKNKTVTEDLVQEIYIRIIHSYHRFRGESSEKTWAFSIARHVVYDYFRREKRKKKFTNKTVGWDEMHNIVPTDEKLPDEIIIQDEEVQLMFRLLDELNLNQKQVIVLRFVNGCSIKETAELLHLTTSNVKTLQHRGIKKLKSLLKARKGEGGMENASN